MYPYPSEPKTEERLKLLSDTAAQMDLLRALCDQVAAALERARLIADLSRANAAKDRLLATLSHELRTPLAPVLAVVSGLEATNACGEGSAASFLRHVTKSVPLRGLEAAIGQAAEGS